MYCEFSRPASVMEICFLARMEEELSKKDPRRLVSGVTFVVLLLGMSE
jgi:hypothetical protein